MWVVEGRSSPKAYIPFFQWGRSDWWRLVVVAEHGEVMLIDYGHGLLLSILDVCRKLM